MGWFAVVVAGLAMTPSLHAQIAQPGPVVRPPTNAGRELEAAKPQQPAVQKKDEDVLQRPDAAQRAAAPAGPTILVKGFRITGNTVFSDDELQAILKPYVGQQLGTEQLLDAAEQVKNRYKDAGYFLTQVFIPPQEVPDGVVALRIVEAHIGKTRADVQSARVKPELVDGYMGLLPSGSAVTEQAVERPLLLLNDLPGIKVNSVLKPGASFGEADLDVKVVDEGPAFNGDAYLDNSGNEATGMVRVGADVGADGLLGFGERWTLGGMVTEHNGVNLVRAGVTTPVGTLGTKLTLSATSLNYKVVGEDFQKLQADGYAYVASGFFQHPLIRSRNTNVFLLFGLDLKAVNDRALSGAVQNDRHLVIGNLGVTGDFRDSYFGGSLNSYTATFYPGQNDIRTPDAKARDQLASGHHTAGHFEHLNGDFQRLQAITSSTSLLLSMRGQVAFENLDSTEKGSLGGPHGVRAYAVGDGVGDDLFQSTLELRQTIPGWSLFGSPFVFSAFVDGGRVRNWHDPLSTDNNNTFTLGGYGLGVNLTTRDNFQFRLDVAAKINGLTLPGSDNRDPRAWATLQKWF
jgi:hemolysin activation/secretion protein